MSGQSESAHHVGIHYNMETDELAKKRTFTAIIESEPACGVRK